MKPYTISRNSLCPCRSGKKFKHCCANTLSTDIKDKYGELFQAKQYARALIAYRAFLTQYIIWYNEHTVPFVEDRPLEADSLLSLDIDAVIETVHGITSCFRQLGEFDEIDPFLIRASDIITEERYEFCILGERTLNFLIQGNESKTKQILSSIKNIDVSRMATTYYCRQYLDLFSEFFWYEIPLAKNLEILEKLLSKVDDSLGELNQIARKAIILFVYLDLESATSEIDKAISKLQQLKGTANKDQQMLMTGALLYKEKGIICADKSAMLKACDMCEALLVLSDDCEYSSTINHCLGQLYENLGDNHKANHHFHIAYDLISTPKDAVTIDLAKSYALLGDTKKAQEYLQTLELNSIKDILKIDYYMVSAQIAIQDKNRDFASQILQQILELKVAIPIFRELISNNRSALAEMIADGKDSISILQRFREVVSKYLLLQPNFFGLGINLNELIAPKKHDRKE